jgi:hypothetical protein
VLNGFSYDHLAVRHRSWAHSSAVVERPAPRLIPCLGPSHWIFVVDSRQDLTCVLTAHWAHPNHQIRRIMTPTSIKKTPPEPQSKGIFGLIFWPSDIPVDAISIAVQAANLVINKHAKMVASSRIEPTQSTRNRWPASHVECVVRRRVSLPRPFGNRVRSGIGTF